MLTLPDNHFEDCAEDTTSITIKHAVWVCAALCALVLVALTPRSALAVQTAFASPAIAVKEDYAAGFALLAYSARHQAQAHRTISGVIAE